MRLAATIDSATMKRLSVYLAIFPLIAVLFLIALGLVRSGAPHLLFVSAAAFVLMLLPALIVWAVDVVAGKALWCVIAGFITVPLAIDAALYTVAHPRVLESLYFAIAGAVAAAVCRAVGAAATRDRSRIAKPPEAP